MEKPYWQEVIQIKDTLTQDILIKSYIIFWAKFLNIGTKICLIPILLLFYYLFQKNLIILNISYIMLFASFFYCMIVTKILILPKDEGFGYLWSYYIEDFLVEVEKSKNKIDSFDAILISVKKIHNFMGYLMSLYKKSSFLLTSESVPKLKIALEKAFSLIINILSNLRSDLQLRLAEQQKTLEQAKTEVEQNIHGTTELEQVSELQRARLDQQIEQFEELQKVLVRV